MHPFLFFLMLMSSSVASATTQVNFKNVFTDKDGCFVMSDVKTGKVVLEHNKTRCEKRFSPYSTFKIAASIMAFEQGVFKNENQVIRWDGVKRDRAETNRDQTPMTFMSDSVKWVTEWIMPQLGNAQIEKYLDKFEYGNKDFSGGLKDAWVSSSLKISAHEQLHFLSNFWNEKLALSPKTAALTKKVMLIKKFSDGTELYGKTGTGCLQGNDCMTKPDKMIGWFVGFLKTQNVTYVFAGNASDLRPQERPGGPRMRQTTLEILKQMNLISE